MNDTRDRWEFPDLSKYAENRNKFPLDELDKYAGKYVAWSPDGTRIVACGDDREALWKELEAAGIDISQVVGEFIPPSDMVLLL
jgi:hypothetical protein